MENCDDLNNRHIYNTDIGKVCMSEKEYEIYIEKKAERDFENFESNSKKEKIQNGR